jgi:hypothetical protein
LIGLVFAVPSAFSFLISSGHVCSNIFSSFYSCGYAMDYETLSIGAVSAFAAACEFILGVKRKGGGELFWESGGQRLLRRAGSFFMLAGFVTAVYCFSRTNGTPVSYLVPWSAIGVIGVAFYIGLAVIGMGVSCIFGSRYIKIKPVRSASVKLLTQLN